MRFLIDECTGPAVARWLREQNHEVFSLYEEARGLTSRLPDSGRSARKGRDWRGGANKATG